MEKIRQQNILMTRFPYEAVFSGEEIHTLLLAEKLREKKSQISFAGSCPVLIPEFQKRGFTVRKFWGGKALVSVKSFWIFLITFPFVCLNFLRLAWVAKFQSKTDLVYMLSLNEKLFLTPWLLCLGIKVVWVEHSRIGDWLEKNPLLFLYRFLSKFVRIISVSQVTQKQLIHLGIKKEKVHFVLNGVDFQALENVDEQKLKNFQSLRLRSLRLRSENFQPCSENFQPCSENFQFCPENFQLCSENFQFCPENCQLCPSSEVEGKVKRIGLITRLYYDKGLDYFLGAVRELRKKQKNVEVYLVGEGPYQKDFEFFAKDLPVTFLGKLEHADIKYFLHSIDYFILPSSAHDPFGLAPAEAMICRKPVIVTDVCGISRFMRNEENGLIIPAKNVKAIVDALEKLMTNTEFSQKIAESGCQLAKEKFGLERMVGEYEKILSFSSEVNVDS